MDPSNVVVAFRRRLLASQDAGTCALVVPAMVPVLNHRVLSLRQHPPQDACPIDIYVWVPEQLKPAHTRARRLQPEEASPPCGGRLGVQAGSSAMVMGGRTQRALTCATDYVAPQDGATPTADAPTAAAYRIQGSFTLGGKFQ